MLPATGPCRGYLKRFYYNVDTGRCEFFVYGGCGGNNNRFNTEQECYYECTIKERVDGKLS